MKDATLQLIATLPSVSSRSKIQAMLECDLICGVRLNTGAFNPFDETDTVGWLAEQCRIYNKRFWVDLKCRQLRVTRWAAPEYQCIEVNHTLSVDLPAQLSLRGEAPLDIVNISGNRITVNPLPKYAVGEGQSVNVIGNNLQIHGYLIEKDIRYLQACRALDVCDIMASYAELPQDVDEILSYLPNASITCKIESIKGVDAIYGFVDKGCNLMAARDDLYIESGFSPALLAMTKRIVEADPDAICASRIFQSLERNERVSLCDFSDLELMCAYGYRRFMLSDRISINHLEAACRAWRSFLGV
ncbi:MAG: pyruvate kinase [Clostridia bacterium]|nr:pyruvate kinase [Clostridia bacterium]